MNEGQSGLVSVVVPVYNGEAYIDRCFQSLFKQTYRPLQIIFVDDGSEDNTYVHLLGLKKTFRQSDFEVIVLTVKHNGQAAAVNVALPYVGGEYFTWCDADDWLTPDSVEKKVGYLRGHLSVGIVRSNGYIVDGNTGIQIGCSASDEDKLSENVFDDLFFDRTFCYAGCYLMRTSLLWECYSDKAIPISQEGQNLQLLLPALSRSKCGFVSECLHFYWQQSGSHSRVGRSFLECLKRLNNFILLKRDLLPYCVCDREFYEQKLDEMLDGYKQYIVDVALKRIREGGT